MRQVWRVAARELRELSRQPAMVGAAVAIYSLIAALVLGALALLDLVYGKPRQVSDVLAAAGLEATSLDPFAGSLVDAANFMSLAQLITLTGVLAGHSLLHDREQGTLPFLLLAPLRRWQLLLGKVLGAVMLPLAVYLVVGGGMCGLAACLEVTSAARDALPPSGGWLVAFLVNGPLFALGVGVLCAVVSSLSRDVRTAQQVVALLGFLATFTVGAGIALLIPAGALVQLGIAACGAFLLVLLVSGGATVISRDLGR